MDMSPLRCRGRPWRSHAEKLASMHHPFLDAAHTWPSKSERCWRKSGVYRRMADPASEVQPQVVLVIRGFAHVARIATQRPQQFDPMFNAVHTPFQQWSLRAEACDSRHAANSRTFWSQHSSCTFAFQPSETLEAYVICEASIRQHGKPRAQNGGHVAPNLHLVVPSVATAASARKNESVLHRHCACLRRNVVCRLVLLPIMV